MSYFMFRTQIISKSNRSAVASAAYRSGEALFSERDGLLKKYGHRDVEPETYILAPKHAPNWVNNREQLWNEVEKIEKQHNAQLAREIIIALPTKLTNEEQTDLTLDFCKKNFSDEGMVADIAIHRDKKHNPHAHIMLTLRPFNEDGTWGNKRKKIENEVKGQKRKVSVHLTNWNEKETLIKWRRDLAERINEKFKEKGLSDRVTHESYQKQGIDKVPQIRLSREAYQYEQRVKQESLNKGTEYKPVTYYGKLNQEIQEINKELKALRGQEQVVPLEQYKNEKSIEQTLDSIRKNASLNSVQKAALLMVAKRAKTYVDYSIARNVYKEVAEGNWKKKLDTQKLKLQAEKNLINKAYKTYQEEPNRVIQYGFNPKKFNEELKDKISNLKNLQDLFKQDLVKYEAVLKKTELALEVQKDFTKQEFHMLYPNEPKDAYKIEKMYHAVQYFKENGTILHQDKIPEFAIKIEAEKATSVHIPSFAEQTRNISKSLFILDRAVKKQSRERMEALKLRQFEKAYEASQKIERYSLQKAKLSKELEGNKEVLRAELQKHYAIDSLSKVSNTEVLLQLNSIIKRGESTGNLKRDIEVLKQTFEKERDVQRQPQLQEEFVQQHSQEVADGFINAIKEVQRANEHKKYENDPTKKRKRRRYRGQNLER